MSAQNARVKKLKGDEAFTRAATARNGELEVETAPEPRSASATDKDTKQKFWGSFTKGNRGAQKNPTQAALQVAPTIAVNLRDIGKVSDIIKEGILFRSSELISAQEVQRYDIQTVVDLRRMDRPCKQSVNVHERRVRKLLNDIRMVVPEDKKPYNIRGMPHACTVCSERFSERHDHMCEVMHADFIPGRVGFGIFQAMPASIRCQAILAALTGKGAASVMAPAVANPAYMGYKVLYKTVLDQSKRGIAKAIRVLKDERNFPVLVHCIHGKDRTGLLVMLILLLCDIPPAEIVKDYMLSETVLKESRMHQELHLDTYLTSDDVIAATRDCMEDTITYLNEKCGGIFIYLKTCGLEEWELSQIRCNLLAQAAPKDLMERLRRSSTVKLSQNPRNPAANPGMFSRKSRMRHELHRRSDPIASTHSLARESRQHTSLDGMHARHSSTPHDPAGSFSAPVTPPSASFSTTDAAPAAGAFKGAEASRVGARGLRSDSLQANGSGPAASGPLGPDPMRAATIRLRASQGEAISSSPAGMGVPLERGSHVGPDTSGPAASGSLGPDPMRPMTTKGMQPSQAQPHRGFATAPRPAASGPLGPDPMRAPTIKRRLPTSVDGRPGASGYPGEAAAGMAAQGRQLSPGITSSPSSAAPLPVTLGVIGSGDHAAAQAPDGRRDEYLGYQTDSASANAPGAPPHMLAHGAEPAAPRLPASRPLDGRLLDGHAMAHTLPADDLAVSRQHSPATVLRHSHTDEQYASAAVAQPSHAMDSPIHDADAYTQPALPDHSRLVGAGPIFAEQPPGERKPQLASPGDAEHMRAGAPAMASPAPALFGTLRSGPMLPIVLTPGVT